MRSYHIDVAGCLSGLILRKHTIPEPGTGEVLVRFHAASVGQRDLMVLYDRYVHGIQQGLVPLSDGAGKVVGVGAGVTRFKEGDRVVPNPLQSWIAGPRRAEYSGSGLGGSVDGTLRTHGLFSEQGLVMLPDHLSFAQGAAIGLSGLSAWAALTVGKAVRPGQWVLVQGSGNVALLGLQLAKLFGAKVVVTTRRDGIVHLLQEAGADAVIVISGSAEWWKEVRAVTGGSGVARVLDLVGPVSMNQSVAALAINGDLATIGNLGGPGTLDPLPLVGKSKAIHGIGGGSRQQLEEMLAAISEALMQPVIDRVFPFDDAKSAIKHYERGERFGRVIVEMPA